MSEQQKYYLLVMHNMLLDNGIELGKCEDGDGYCIVRYHDEYYDNPYEDEKFRTVSDLMPVLDTYLNDSYFADLEEMSEGFGIDWSHENVPETCEEWVNFLNEHQEIKEICQYEYEVMDMIANHMDEINFKKLYELHEGEPLYRIKERNARYEAMEQAMEQIQNHPDEVTTLEQFPMKDVGNTYITVKKNPEAENEFLFDVCADKLMSKELGFIKGDLKEVLHALADGSAELFHQDFIRTRATASELIDKGIVKAKNPLNSHPIPEAMSESLIDSLLISRIGTEPIEDVSSNPYVKDVASILRYDIKEFVEDVLPYHQARVDRADCRSNEEHAEYLIARAFLRYSDNLKHHPVCQENDGDWNANIQMKHEGENAILSIEVYKGCKCLAEIDQSLKTKEVTVQEFACSEEQSKMILNALQKLETINEQLKKMHKK